jgi:hypothetical protein
MNNRMDTQRQHQRAQLGLIQAQVQQYLDTTELSLALGGSKSLQGYPHQRLGVY